MMALKCTSCHLSSSRTFSKVNVCLVVFLTLSVFVNFLTSSLTSPNEDLFIDTVSNRFNQLTRPELLQVWHTDCHRRCRYQISSHVEIACQYDPYRVVHRRRRSSVLARVKYNTTVKVMEVSKPSPQNEKNVPKPIYQDQSPFITKHSAASFLRHRRAASRNIASQLLKRSKREVNIMEECCFSKACAWEEFAEYCQRHPRRASERNSVCSYS